MKETKIKEGDRIWHNGLVRVVVSVNGEAAIRALNGTHWVMVNTIKPLPRVIKTKRSKNLCDNA